ncbi:MAG: hypothetical protein F6K31_00240 [Symploca sp. SIO2G7]|nr:hypothetical protein [Symploca sp. SIO2G7]
MCSWGADYSPPAPLTEQPAVSELPLEQILLLPDELLPVPSLEGSYWC